MPGDFSNLPLSGGTILAFILYVLLSLFVTGPMIGERMIEKLRWMDHCKRMVADDLQSSPSAQPLQPNLDCRSLFGWLGPDGERLCRKHGHLKLPFADQLTEYQDRIRLQNDMRLANAVAQIQDRCACAAALTLESRRTAFAIAAGSARLVMPAPVKNLSAELNAALHTAACRMKGDAS